MKDGISTRLARTIKVIFRIQGIQVMCLVVYLVMVVFTHSLNSNAKNNFKKIIS